MYAAFILHREFFLFSYVKQKLEIFLKCIFVNNNTVLSQMFIFQQGAIQQIVYT